MYEVSIAKSGALQNEPGVCVMSSINVITKGKCFRIQIVNETAKSVHLKKGYVVVQVEGLSDFHIEPSEPIVHLNTIRYVEQNGGEKHEFTTGCSRPENIFREKSIFDNQFYFISITPYIWTCTI